MSDYFGFSNSWPQPVMDAWRKQNKLAYRFRCLEAQLDRIDYADFEKLFEEIERVRSELVAARIEFEQLQRSCGFTI